MAVPTDYDRNVFINCPFDRSYDRLFRAIIFTVLNLGLNPLSARVRSASEQRLKKICELIQISKFGVHDISKIKLDKGSGLPRFNMPFELGLDIGCKEFSDRHRDKVLVVVEFKKYESQKFLSDILGYDPDGHQNLLWKLIELVSNPIRSELNNPLLPHGKRIYRDFKLFEETYKEAKKDLPKDPAFIDIVYLAARWINETHLLRDSKAPGRD